MFAQLLAEAIVGAGFTMAGFILAMLNLGSLFFLAERFGWVKPGVTLSGGPR